MPRFFRLGWPVIIPLYDARECPECRALVCGRGPQREHERWHRDLHERLNDLDDTVDAVVPELEGYIVGNGPLPASVRGGGDE
jgi:hypothetical protein